MRFNALMFKASIAGLVLCLCTSDLLATELNQAGYTRFWPFRAIIWKNLSFDKKDHLPVNCSREWKTVKKSYLRFKLRVECKSTEKFLQEVNGQEARLDMLLSKLDILYHYVYGSDAKERSIQIVFVYYKNNFGRTVYRLFFNTPPMYLVSSFWDIDSLLKRISSTVFHEMFHLHSYIAFHDFIGNGVEDEELIAKLMGECGKVLGGERNAEKFQPFPDIYPAYRKGLTPEQALRQSVFWRDNKDIKNFDAYRKAALGYVRNLYKIWDFVGPEVRDPEKVYALCRWTWQHPNDYLQAEDLGQVDLSAELAALPEPLQYEKTPRKMH